MTHFESQQGELETAQGTVFVASFYTPDNLESLSFKRSFQMHPHYSPIISSKKSLMRIAGEPDANVTLATTVDGDIVGFGILQYPDPDERWVRVGERVMMELSVVEVSRAWRGGGLAKKILEYALAHPLQDEKIFYMVGYSWTWDIAGSDLPIMAYRDMMIGLFAGFGFGLRQTNEPNIMMRPENMFMVRIGTNVTEAVRRRLKQVQFNLD
jgi:acetoin utilization protein AcuA